MKNILFLFLAFGLLTFTACGDDDTVEEVIPEYHIHFLTPAEDGTTTSMQNETLSIEIEIEEHTLTTVHHVNVRIFKKDDESIVLYDGPNEEHVHETDGKYDFKYDLFLDSSIVDGHTDWIVEAKAWGEQDGLAEVTATAQFHVHPM